MRSGLRRNQFLGASVLGPIHQEFAMKYFVLVGALGIALQLTMVQSSNAQNFSVESGSVDTAFGFPPGDDILMPGPIPVLAGGTGGATDVNGFSYGRHTAFEDPPIAIDFSVDSGSVGTAASDVGLEWAAGPPAFGAGNVNYDVFRSGLGGTNVQVHDGDGVGLGAASPLGMFEPQTVVSPSGFGSGVDGYDNRPGPGGAGSSIYWTWDSTLGLGPSASGADILVTTLPAPGYVPAGVPYALAGALGLAASDNIDALEVWDIGASPGVYDAGDIVLFSLDPGSLVGLGAYGATPADILISAGAGGFTGVFIPEAALGLVGGDNVTAISVNVIPEPGSAMICLVAFGLAAAKRRRRS